MGAHYGRRLSVPYVQGEPVVSTIEDQLAYTVRVRVPAAR